MTVGIKKEEIMDDNSQVCKSVACASTDFQGLLKESNIMRKLGKV